MSGGSPSRWADRGWPLVGARLILGGTLLVMGVAKAGDPVGFLKLVREYDMVPREWPWLLNGMAVTLPWIEMCCGALLLLGVAVRGAALTSVALLAVFTLAIASRAMGLLASDSAPTLCAIHFDCGCGAGDVYICPKLAQNVGLLLLGVVALWSRSARYCLRRCLFG